MSAGLASNEYALKINVKGNSPILSTHSTSRLASSNLEVISVLFKGCGWEVEVMV